MKLYLGEIYFEKNEKGGSPFIVSVVAKNLKEAKKIALKQLYKKFPGYKKQGNIIYEYWMHTELKNGSSIVNIV